MKPVRIFPELYNISDFISDEHPVYHPDSRAYSEYWSNQEKLCIEGLWGHDFDGVQGGWRYCPGPVYYYVTFTIIEQKGKNNSTVIKKPKLYDTVWMLGYGQITCRGFSGFMDDEQITCNEIAKLLHQDIELTPEQLIRLEEVKNEIYKKDGTLKEYKDPIQYLYNTFENPLGLPLYSNTAKNFFCLGPRGFG